MGTLSTRLAALRATFTHRAPSAAPALVPFVMAGDGGADDTLAVLAGLESGGAAAIELGLAHTDPIADGPVVRAAGERALAAGVGFDAYVDLVREHRRRGGRVPIVAFGYTNVLFEAHGAAGVARLADAGVDALAVADLPPEEADALAQCCARVGLGLVGFVAPTTDGARLQRVTEFATAFVYAVARRGTTGRRSSIDAELAERLAALRSVGARPLAVGFGIADAAQVAALNGHADLVVVGSALVEHLHHVRTCGDGDVERAAHTFLRGLAARELTPS
jgi:tryptophan synthase alpha chain